MSAVTRRDLLIGSAALAGASGLTALAAHRVFAAVDDKLSISRLTHEIVKGKPTVEMMSFAADGPPPVIRMRQGERFAIEVANRLGEDTTVHWHGLRIDNAMDGVPYLTQAPIRDGTSFRYSFTPPDAGTFWYHPHCNTLEQMARGMTGMLVVEDAEDPGFDSDLPLNIRDFRIGSEGQFLEFYKARNTARGGTLGTVNTVNWQIDPVYNVEAGTLVRLRMAVTDLTRIGQYSVKGGEARLIALDSHGLPAPVAPERIEMAPGQRADIALRVPDHEGEEVELILERPTTPVRLARFRATGASARRQLAELKPLAPNPVAEPDLANAELQEYVFGWSPGGDAPANPICGSLGYLFWSINRIAWQGDFPDPLAPLGVMKQGRSYILRLRNETPYDHPIHLHGLTFRLLRSNKREIAPLWTDTALLRAEETMEVGLVADNPGDWAFHCHVIEHQKTGLAGFLRVDA
ncbi:multicopper oxidase family protein [Nisaea acidiphila]|uniref:Multicopper oxidase family protein n=1 Tax=Nisaea acidiphila TaxID=1862145 RepID=A0A9J7AQE6_9PROT|nr:multicopper oxidase family protein [Nisaea acidiphila]UUX49624.1 multicopper oxidase family protein [Nisaea acidiphila]